MQLRSELWKINKFESRKQKVIRNLGWLAGSIEWLHEVAAADVLKLYEKMRAMDRSLPERKSTEMMDQDIEAGGEVGNRLST